MNQAKRELRAELRRRRVAVTDPNTGSNRILQRLQQLDSWRDAKVICVYIGIRSEVPTASWVQIIRDSGRIVCVPWCDGERLRLCRIESISDLIPGAYNIPEPPRDWKQQPDRELTVDDCDLIYVPGVGFDRDCRRLGQGGGYYDRLMDGCSSGTTFVGIAFAEQIVSVVPSEAHDQRVDCVVTEDEVIRPPE